MRSSSREEVVEVFDALQAAMKRALDLRCDALMTPERLALLQTCEKVRRWLPAVEHPLINQLSQQADASRVGRETGRGAGQPVADHPRRSLAAHPRSRRSRRTHRPQR